MIDARVGNESINAAVSGDDGIDGGSGCAVVGHVERRAMGLQSTFTQTHGGSFDPIRAAAIGYDSCTGLCQAFGHRKSKAARRAGNERNMPIKRE
jgi:hypothetical protein